VKTHLYRLGGEALPVYEVETESDATCFMDWLVLSPLVAVDTENTGLNIYTPGFEVRLVQFGDETQAYVLDAQRWESTIREALAYIQARPDFRMVFHNATYDILALERMGFLPDLSAFAQSHDTYLMAHLLDPLQVLKLKDLGRRHVDPAAADSQEALHAVFKERGWKKDEGWARIEKDHPTYVLYAGGDVILTARLFQVLGREVHARGLGRLLDFEREVQAICAEMEARGLRLDVDYALNDLTPYLQERADVGRATAAKYGIANVNSTAQVSEVLAAMGAVLVEQTPTGKDKVDKAVLTAIWENNPGTALADVAEAVYYAKNASKFHTTYVDTSLALRDGGDRVHPSISSLEARTARMSVSKPPLQQLPSGDWRIRRMFLADEGQAMLSVDYSQVELRILAALAKERKMLAAINEGLDLHDVTAVALYGEGFTKLQRKLAKNTGFGRVYGGGATTLARQAGVDIPTAKKAMRGYDDAFPGIKSYSRKLVERAEWGAREVVTPSGRHLPLDRDRLYAATNYVVQSTARDVLGQALIDLKKEGLSGHLLLPIHDEVLAQAPVADAEEVARTIAKVMTMPFYGVTLTAEPEVYGRNWGMGYGGPE
jgi:DNA polymerase-1